MDKGGVYVLALQTGAVYVGKSHNVQQRVAQQENPRLACAWVRQNGGVRRVLPVLTQRQENLENWEQNETIAQMRQHGFERVRGWEFTQCGPLTTAQRETIKTLVCGTYNLCRRCGHGGHFATKCSGGPRVAAWLAELLSAPGSRMREQGSGQRVGKRKRGACSRCLRTGHTRDDCYARRDIYGRELGDSEGSWDSFSDSYSACSDDF